MPAQYGFKPDEHRQGGSPWVWDDGEQDRKQSPVCPRRLRPSRLLTPQDSQLMTQLSALFENQATSAL
jgi:hypothetical protein